MQCAVTALNTLGEIPKAIVLGHLKTFIKAELDKTLKEPWLVNDTIISPAVSEAQEAIAGLQAKIAELIVNKNNLLEAFDTALQPFWTLAAGCPSLLALKKSLEDEIAEIDLEIAANQAALGKAQGVLTVVQTNLASKQGAFDTTLGLAAEFGIEVPAWLK